MVSRNLSAHIYEFSDQHCPNETTLLDVYTGLTLYVNEIKNV